jgi:hypothetical protein
VEEGEGRGEYTEKKVMYRWRHSVKGCIYKPRNTKNVQHLSENTTEAWKEFPFRISLRSQQPDFSLLVSRIMKNIFLLD